jgi:type VI secretion system ImpM family protein
MTGAPLAALGALGKLSSDAEYIHHNAAGEAFRAMDDLLADSIESSARRAGDAWSTRFASGAVHVFVFKQSESDTFLAGAIRPSRDRAGRAFPFLVAAELTIEPAQLSAPEIVPLSLEHLWKHAHRLAAESVDNGVLDADSLSSPLGAAEDLAEARRSYEEWTRSLPLADLDTLLYGTGNEPRLASALREALAAIAPHRGIEPPRTRLSVRLPLGSSGGAAVCFWLAFFRRALAWHSVLPTFFWTHSGEAGQLLLSLGRPAASVLDQLWLPGSVSDDLCDLAGEQSAESWTTAPPEIESVLGDPSSTISDLLVAICASE